MSARIVRVEASRPYEVHVGRYLLGRLGALCRDAGLDGRVAIVSDTNVLARWLTPALAGLRAEGFEVSTIAVPPGEATKTLASAERIHGHLAEAGHGRGDAVIALGGGVVGDLAGFVAATYHRGVPLVHAPTTLLAQVDASIGGKTAVDHPLAKNLIGAFHVPRLVVADVETLSTLPRRERFGGLAEVAKAALLEGGPLLEALERELEALGEGEADPAALVEVVERAARVKAEVVAADERDEGVRARLNLGHTLGHALEAATGFGPLLHGEAVVVGLRVAIALSRRLAGLGEADAARALALLRRFPAPQVKRPPREAVLAAALRDKKGGRFVALERLGAARVLPALPEGELEAAVDLALEELR